jgi:hypothetical protein
MREDMSRVIVERPRHGGDRGRKGRSVPSDALPKQEGMRRKHVLSGGCKLLQATEREPLATATLP